MSTPIDAALSVLKTDLRFGEQDPNDPNPMYLDLRRRGFGYDLVDDQGREADFADEFTSAVGRHNDENYVGYYDDDDDYAGYYDEYRTSPQELREQAMSELDDKDRAAAARMIDHIKNMDIGNAMFLAHAGGRGFNVPEEEQDALIAQAQQEADAGQEGARLHAREGFYGPHNMFRQPEFFDRALPLGPDTKLASLDTPTDVAFSVLKPEEEVRKILPALMLGYGAYQGIKNVRDNKVTDPILGTELAEGDDSLGSTALQFGTGLAQGALPLGSLKLGGKVGGKVLARRRAGKYAAAQKEAAEASAKHARMSAQQQRASLQSQNPGIVFGQTVQPLPPSQVGAARTAMQQANARVARYAPKAAKAPKQRSVLTPLAVGGGIAYAGQQIADALGNMSMGGGGGAAAPSGSGIGGSQQQQGQFALAGDPSGGVGNLQNVGVGQTGREQIWQQGGSGTFKGETMTFTHYEGNEMLRKTLEDLDKMHCGTEQKAEEDKGGKKSKKPAHGMVIVIGSKNAGPGPSTDGKRDSKD